MQKDTFEVLNEQEGERLDKYLSDIYPELSRSFFQKLIKENNILVNGSNQKSNYRLKTDDIVEITIPDRCVNPWICILLNKLQNCKQSSQHIRRFLALYI